MIIVIVIVFFFLVYTSCHKCNPRIWIQIFVFSQKGYHMNVQHEKRSSYAVLIYDSSIVYIRFKTLRSNLKSYSIFLPFFSFFANIIFQYFSYSLWRVPIIEGQNFGIIKNSKDVHIWEQLACWIMPCLSRVGAGMDTHHQWPIL